MNLYICDGQSYFLKSTYLQLLRQCTIFVTTRERSWAQHTNQNKEASHSTYLHEIKLDGGGVAFCDQNWTEHCVFSRGHFSDGPAPAPANFLFNFILSKPVKIKLNHLSSVWDAGPSPIAVPLETQHSNSYGGRRRDSGFQIACSII